MEALWEADALCRAEELSEVQALCETEVLREAEALTWLRMQACLGVL